MIKLDNAIKGWHQVTDTEDLREGNVYFVEWFKGCANFMLLLKHEKVDLPFGTEILHFCSSIGEEAHHIRLNPEVDKFSVYAPEDAYNDGDKLSVEEASKLLKYLGDKCLQIAKENWTENQYSMLEKLFESVRRDVPYKCVNCKNFDKLINKHDSIIEVDGCVYVFTEDEAEQIICPCDFE